MDPVLVDLVEQESQSWDSDDAADRVAAMQGIVDQYLASEGDDAMVTVVSGDLATDGAAGYYDTGSDTIILDDQTVQDDDFEDALEETLHEALHAESYHETGETYAGDPMDQPDASSGDGFDFTDDDIEALNDEMAPTPTGYGAMVGDTLVIEAADPDVPAGHQELDVEAQALAAELMSQSTGGSSAPGVSSAGGGSEPGEGNDIVITEPLFDFDFSQP
jgi:hypothetical protein